MLRALPADTGMAFVLIQHLSPDRPSMLSDILSRVTSLPVTEVRDQQKAEPNRVYVIPPDRDMVIAKGVLQLVPRETRVQHRPIDHFFHSLAVDQGHRAIGVVLSGTASDGTLGLREIKAAGGITFAQDDTAQQRGMPTSAVAAGCVDLVLAPQAIAEELARVAHHPYVVPVVASPPVPAADGSEAAILRVLHRETGVDFLRYKANTLHRRISRRMLLHRIDGLVEYARYLDENPAEAQALYQDILINVTSFFRNPEQFEALESKFLPRLLEGRAPNDPLRAWVVGCSTGEEAYSLAITISESLESAGKEDHFQVFATDLNAAGIEKARAGIYPKSIDRDVSPQRLHRFFSEEDGSYRISKAIRDLCVFARHNVATDPPFSRVDLVICRNLLIYLEPDMQQRILPVLHFALNPSGLLLLGSSETAGGYRDLFEVEDAGNKIYSKRAGSRAVVFHGTHAAASPQSGKLAELPTESGRGAGPDEEIRRVLLEHFAPAAIVINARMEIVQFRGDTAPYIAPSPGKATLSVLTMARSGFQVPLRASIQRAKQEQVPIRTDRIRVMTDDGPREFSLEVVPIPGPGPLADLYLVVFDSAVRARRIKPGATGPSSVGRLRGWVRSLLLRDRRRGAQGVPEAKQESAEEQLLRMSQELAASREYLQSIIATQEVANEELQSANEEAQSANEELQSINEELETSKEEIQATSEELTTVNDELQHRTAEISRINDDLVNLINSVRLAIVILGPDMSIRRFTPEAEQMLSLHPADAGRSIHDVKLRIDVLGLEGALAQAIDTGTAQELSVQDPAGRWWSLRIRPYRTVENRVEGAVLMLVDVDALQRSRDYAESIVQAVREPLLVLDGNLTVQRASRAYYEMFRTTPEETERCSFPDIGNGPWRAPGLQSALQLVRSGGQPLDRFEVLGEFPFIGRRVMLLTARRLPYEGDSSLILVAIEDATEQRDAETALITRVEDLRAADQSKDEFLAMLAHELRGPLSPIRVAAQILSDPGADDAMVKRARATIERQSQRMARLIDDLLDVARITQRKIDLRREPVDLGSALERAVELVRDLSGSRGQEIVVTAPPVPITLNADPGRLEQVFANLLNNASKFSDRGARIWLTFGLVAGTGSSPAMAEVRVRDEGIGIAPELLPRVFDLFLQADRSLERAQGGLGIGLTIVRRLVEMHGGMVEVVSEGLGRGSEFIVRLPAVRQGEGALSRRKPAGGGVPAAPRAAPRRVVVADDSVDSADSLGALLSLAGCDVRVVYDGPAALEVSESFRPEVMVLDIGLPGMTGYEVVRRLRARGGPGEILLIAVTGYGQAHDIELSRDAGFDHHLTKPVDIKVLRDLLGLPSPPRPQGAPGR